MTIFTGCQSNWKRCDPTLDGDFWAFRTQQPGTVKIKCNAKSSNYFYSGPDYSSSWSACPSTYFGDFYAFPTQQPGTVKIGCSERGSGSDYFWGQVGGKHNYVTNWGACKAEWDADFYAYPDSTMGRGALTPPDVPWNTLPCSPDRAAFSRGRRAT